MIQFYTMPLPVVGHDMPLITAMIQEDLFNQNPSSHSPSSLPGLSEFGTLQQLYEATKDCQKCRLGKTRKNYVFGDGSPTAKVVVIGEAPGADEDEQGKPFVGRSGQLLTKILNSIHFQREEIYIANIIKSRPPENRPPRPDEVEACLPHLHRQIELIRPKMILAVGRVAANTLLGNTHSMSALRGKIHLWRGIDLVVTFHPAALLRNPNWKALCWEDVKFFRRVFDERYQHAG